MENRNLILNRQKISYLELGQKKGLPVFFFHGFPGSASQALIFHDYLVSHGLHILSPNRPGYGESSPSSHGFRFFIENCFRLADEHGWERFHVVGVSGGAPYARYMALAGGKRILSCLTIAGLGILNSQQLSNMRPYEKWGLTFLRHSPSVLSYAILSQLVKKATPEKAFENMMQRSSPIDQKQLQVEQVAGLMAESFLIATKQGPHGIHFDLQNYAKHDRETLGSFHCPVVLFHGTEDQIVPYQMSQELAQQIPRSELITVEKEGHYSLAISQAKLFADKLRELHQQNPT